LRSPGLFFFLRAIWTARSVFSAILDGEHFTPAGDLLVAAYLLPKMTATLVKGGAKLGEACAS
jgi:hypothetical protein